MSGSLTPDTATTELRSRSFTAFRPGAIVAVPPDHQPMPSVALMPDAASRCSRSIWYSQVGQSESLT